MKVLDVFTKINIKDYLARPEAQFDKQYLEERQKIRQYIGKDDLAAKRDGGVFDWSYLLNAADSFKNDLKFFLFHLEYLSNLGHYNIYNN